MSSDPIDTLKAVLPILASFFSFVGGYSVYKLTEHKENRRFHISELKKSVISPLIDCLEGKYKFPSIEEAENNNVQHAVDFSLMYNTVEKLFNGVLVDDFLTNHCPEVRKLWSDYYNILKEVENKSTNLEKLVSQKLIEEIREHDYKIDIDHVSRHAVYFDTFKSVITALLFAKNTTAKNIIEDPSDPGRILFEEKIIYIINSDEIVQRAIADFTTISNSMLMNEQTKNLVITCESVVQKRDKYKRELYMKLNVLVNKQSFKFLRKNLGFTKCQLI